MKLITILLALAFAIFIAGAPVGPPSAWNLSVEPSDDTSGTDDVGIASDLPALPGFAGMLRNDTSTSVDRYAIIDTTQSIELDHGTCKHIVLGGGGIVGETSLEAKCVDEEGTWWDTSLNLNECAANDRGFLIFREEGNFDESCRPCVVVDPVEAEGLQLKCRCVNKDGKEQYALLPLGSHGKFGIPLTYRCTLTNSSDSQKPSGYQTCRRPAHLWQQTRYADAELL